MNEPSRLALSSPSSPLKRPAVKTRPGIHHELAGNSGFDVAEHFPHRAIHEDLADFVLNRCIQDDFASTSGKTTNFQLVRIR